MRVDYSYGYPTIIHKYDKPVTGSSSSYAPGNENLTNPSMLSLVVKEGVLQRQQDTESQYIKDWVIRVFESSNPIVSPDPHNRYGTEPFYSEPAYGYHLVVVASPNADDTFATISREQWSNVLLVIQDRIRWLYAQKGVAYVTVYGDHGRLTESADTHPHFNMITLRDIPPIIKREIIAQHKIQNESGSCPICRIVATKDNNARKILHTDNFIAFCPWSSPYPFSFWIAKRKHTVSFVDITQREVRDLALILRATLGGLSRVVEDVSYSISFHLSVERKSSKQIHWHLEVQPVTKKWSGMERGYGIYLNDTTPEDVAKRLAAACKKELTSIVGIS